MYKFTRQNIVNAIYSGNLFYPMIEYIEVKYSNDLLKYKVTSIGIDEHEYNGSVEYENNKFIIDELIDKLLTLNIKCIRTRTENLLKDIWSNHEPIYGKIVTFEIGKEQK